MSVLIPDLQVYNYLQAGIEKMAFTNVIDDFFSQSIRSHFKNCPDISEEAERLIKSWLSLNQESYNRRYPKERDDINLCGMYYPTFTHKPLTSVQTLKYLQCVSYNIEIEPELLKKDIDLLKNCILDLLQAIVSNSEEYKKATWSE
jgi:hypothetical protein